MSASGFHQLVLGVIQGLTEFLPVSSSAHLILFPRFFHWPDPGLAFDVALHLGTLAGLLLYFWKDLWSLGRSALAPSDAALRPQRHLLLCLLLATIPGALLGLALEHKAEEAFRSPFLIACTLIALGLLLAVADKWFSGEEPLDSMTWRSALLIGAAQGLALIPGISRSGITITAALMLGFRRDDAARFSFLMAAPIIAGAGLLKAREILSSPDKVGLALGFLGAAVTGFLAIWALFSYVRSRRYTPFVVYRCALGAFVLLNLGRFAG